MRKRIYIYRRGATDDCALTGAKDDPRLPSLAAPDRWQFWMQIGPLQSVHREHGFDIRAAVQEIVANGYHAGSGHPRFRGDCGNPPSLAGAAGAADTLRPDTYMIVDGGPWPWREASLSVTGATTADTRRDACWIGCGRPTRSISSSWTWMILARPGLREGALKTGRSL